MSILKPDGLFVLITPNGSLEFRKKESDVWNKFWGLVHPNFIDVKYYEAAFSNKCYLISSDPYPLHEIERWGTGAASGNHVFNLEGRELLLLTRK